MIYDDGWRGTCRICGQTVFDYGDDPEDASLTDEQRDAICVDDPERFLDFLHAECAKAAAA